MVHQTHFIEINYGKPVTVMFFGDTQHGAEGFSEEIWQEFKKRFKSLLPNVYVLGLGDYMNWLRTTTRAKIQGALAGDNSIRQELENILMREQDKSIIPEFEAFKGHCLGLHLGHHDWELLTQMTMTQRLCAAIEAPYLGWMASTRLSFSFPGGHQTKTEGAIARNNNKSVGSYTMISMHGTGAARHTATDMRWMDVNIVPAWIADFYVRGHGCKNGNWSPFTRNIIKRKGPAGYAKKPVQCMYVGGFCDGYTDGWNSSYVERAGYTPQPLGWGELKFEVTKARDAADRAGIKAGCVLTASPYNKVF